MDALKGDRRQNYSSEAESRDEPMTALTPG